MLICNQSQYESKGENSKQISEYMFMESEEKRKQLENKIQEVDLKLKAANQNLCDRDKKIMFLQKLVIEKDNREFHAAQKYRKSEKIKEDLSN